MTRVLTLPTPVVSSLTATTIVASTSATTPKVIGGTGTTSTLTLQPTSGAGTTNADIIFGVGNNGATEAMRILNSTKVKINGANTTGQLNVKGSSLSASFDGILVQYDANEVLRLGYIDATAPTNSIVPAQILWGHNGTYGSLMIAARGDAASTNISFYTSGASPGLVEQVRLLGTGVLSCKFSTADTSGGVQAVNFGSTSATFGIYWGTGVPTISAAQGSLYLRRDGGASTEMYVNRDGGTTWKAVTTAA